MSKLDAGEILRSLTLIAEPGRVIELRLLHTAFPGRMPATMSGYFNDFEALSGSVLKYGDAARGVYITLNPINPALLARAANRLRIVGKDDPLTSDADITKRRWLPMDLDPQAGLFAVRGPASPNAAGKRSFGQLLLQIRAEFSEDIRSHR